MTSNTSQPQLPGAHRSRQRGFTLVELVVTVGVLALLIGVALPSFRAVLLRSTVSAHTNDLLAALRLARSEAVKRSQQVEVLANGGNFTTGWVVRVVPTAEVIERRDLVDANIPVLALATGGAADSTRVTFGPTGVMVGATQFDFSICLPLAEADALRSRRIQILQSGSMAARVDTTGAPAGSCS
jgi:type IV fimbrial biogenesis protein FimT